MAKQKDILWKVAIEQLFPDFIYFIDPELLPSIDLDKGFEFMNKELNREFPSDEDGKYGQKIVDKLVKLHLLGRKKEQILLHMEIQEVYNKNFGERMYRYFNRLYDKYNMSIMAYAIFTEPNEIERSDTFVTDYRGTTLTYRFKTCKIALQQNDELINHPSPFALIVLIAKATLLVKGCKSKIEHDKQLLAYKLKIVKLILDRKLPLPKERAIMNFLFYYIDFEFSEYRAIFDSEVNSLINKNIKDMLTFEEVLVEDALRTGYLKGQQKNKEEVALNLIKNFDFSNKQIAICAKISIKTMRKIRAALASEKLN